MVGPKKKSLLLAKIKFEPIFFSGSLAVFKSRAYGAKKK